jgi:hypothetical protein
MMTTLDPRKVFVGMSIGNGQEGVTRWETSMSIIQLLCAGIQEYEFYLCPGGGCDQAHARNLMLHKCLTRTNCGKFLFIDSDERFGAGHVLRLLNWLNQPDIEMIAGLYPLKGEALRWSFGLWSKPSTLHPELWEVGEVCTGFLAFKVELAQRMIDAYPETAYEIDEAEFRGETGHELFAMGPIAAREWIVDGKPKTYKRRMSEDFMFSLRASDMGVTRYVDPKIQLGHIGSFDFAKLHKTAIEEALGRE